MRKIDSAKLIIEKHEKAIREGVNNILWEIWSELDDITNDIEDGTYTVSEIYKKLTDLMDEICL